MSGESWVDVCGVDDVELEDVIEVVTSGDVAVAVYRSPDGAFFATEARCTHGRAALADGLVMSNVIECPKHNGRFDYRTGAAVRVPCLDPLVTYPTRVEGGRVFVAIGADAPDP